MYAIYYEDLSQKIIYLKNERRRKKRTSERKIKIKTKEKKSIITLAWLL
jgi:hypothetical protein